LQRIDKWKLNKDGVIAQRKMIFKKESTEGKDKRPRQEPMTIPTLKSVFEWCKNMEKKANKTKSKEERNKERARQDGEMADFVKRMEELCAKDDNGFHEDLVKKKNKVVMEEPNFDTFQTLPG